MSRFSCAVTRDLPSIIYRIYTLQGRAVRGMQRGPDHPEGRNVSQRFLDFSARAALTVSPYEIYLRSGLRSTNISEKL